MSEEPRSACSSDLAWLIHREEALMRVVWTVKVVQWDLVVHTVPVTTSGPDGTKIR